MGQIYGQRPQYENVQDPTGKNSAFYQLSQLYPNLGSQIKSGSNVLGNEFNITGQELNGQLPLDVQQQIKDAGAAWGLNTGMPGSGAANDFTLADFGINSLQEQQQGFQNASQSFANYSNFLPTLQSLFTLNPEMTAQLDQAEAAPDPRAAGLEHELSGIGGSLLGGVTKLL